MITCYHVTTWYTYLWSLASCLASRTFFASRALRVLRFSYIKSKQNSFKRHHKVTKFLKKSSFSPLRSLHEHHPTVFPSLRSKAVKSLSLRNMYTRLSISSTLSVRHARCTFAPSFVLDLTSDSHSSLCSSASLSCWVRESVSDWKTDIKSN